MFSLRLSGLVVVALSFVPSCQLFLPETCPDLDEVCPDVECEERGGYVQNREGCSTCECVNDQAPEPGAICWDDSECGDSLRCDTVNFCERAPNCDPETGPCPDACYGRCVDDTASCSSDADCKADQVCAFFTNERGEDDAPDGGGGNGGSDEERPDQAPPPGDVPVEPAPAQGVCIDVGCGNADIALPECPPGSELFFDGCNANCVSVDFCRELLPEECRKFPGCELVEESCGGCGTEPGPGGEEAPCDCAFVERCVAIDDCGALPLEECESNPSCVLKVIGGGDEPSDGGAPAPCDPDAPECTEPEPVPPPPPAEQLVCVARGADGTCFSDAECAFGEVCQLTTVCGSGCIVNDDGTQDCFEECWSERGECVVSERTCFDLLPDQCLADPRCELVEGSAPCFCDPADPNCGPCEDVPSQSCQPRELSCASDADCFAGQHCEVFETCPACDPSSANDIDCLAPCFVEGRCVDGAPPPVTCQGDFDCFAGETCVAITVCETCDQGEGGGQGGTGDPIAPPPCDPACRDENVCLQTQPLCFSDADCAGGFCDFSQLDCAAQPGGLLAQCPGVCVEVTTPCQDDTACAAGQRCAIELEAPVCVDDNTAGGAGLCASDGDCANADNTGGTCRFSSSFCLDDPSTDIVECLGWCADACAEVLTPAVDPASGICEVFPDSCIPPGWERAEAC